PLLALPPPRRAPPPSLPAPLPPDLAHVRPPAPLGRLLRPLARALLFWFPFVRFAHRRLDLAREAACDAYALETGEVSRPAYARLLVRMARLEHAAAAELASPHALDARVAAVLGPPARAGPGAGHKLALAGRDPPTRAGARTA